MERQTFGAISLKPGAKRVSTSETPPESAVRAAWRDPRAVASRDPPVASSRRSLQRNAQIHDSLVTVLDVSLA